jgi:hypothetical protein
MYESLKGSQPTSMRYGPSSGFVASKSMGVSVLIVDVDIAKCWC